MPFSVVHDSAEKPVRVAPFLNRTDKQRVIELWNKEYPQHLSFHNEQEFERYLESIEVKSHFIFKDPKQQIVGWSMVFNRDQKTWFAMIVEEPYQYQGIGKALMAAMKNSSHQLNGWVIDHNNDLKENGTNYFTKKDYFVKHDFRILADSRLETPSVSAVQIQWQKD